MADLGALDGFVARSAAVLPGLWGLFEDLRSERRGLLGLSLVGSAEASGLGRLEDVLGVHVFRTVCPPVQYLCITLRIVL